MADSEIEKMLIEAGLESLLNRDEIKQADPHKKPTGLSFEISENGSNLSAGEKQLICICRAILRKNKVVLLDEATANIDMQTE